jgi:hypothetical protein
LGTGPKKAGDRAEGATMTTLPWVGDEAFRRELAALSKTRLKLQISAGALIAIVSGSHVLVGLLDSTITSQGLSLFGLAAGIYIAAHYSLVLMAKRSLTM